MKKLTDRFNILDSGLIIDLMSGRTFSANPTGLVTFRGIVEGKKKQQLIVDLTTEFEIDEQTAARDVEEFIVELQAFNLHEH